MATIPESPTPLQRQFASYWTSNEILLIARLNGQMELWGGDQFTIADELETYRGVEADYDITDERGHRITVLTFDKNGVTRVGHEPYEKKWRTDGQTVQLRPGGKVRQKVSAAKEGREPEKDFTPRLPGKYLTRKDFRKAVRKAFNGRQYTKEDGYYVCNGYRIEYDDKRCIAIITLLDR